jgi:arylsulfatase A-like enzyme
MKLHATWLTAGIMLSALSAQETRPPNIVLFLIDDLGWTDLGVYGSDFHETPHIDRLASQGMTFTQAYANAPNCAPTRACLMSGQYGPRHGIYTVNSSARGRTENRKLIPTPNTRVLADSILTIPEALKAADYTSAAIGKWHLGEDPRSQGFDLNIGGSQAGNPGGYFAPYPNVALADEPEGEYLTERLTEEALAFVDQEREQPFFLYMSYYSVHTPVQGVESLVEKNRQKPKGENHHHPAYAAMVQSVDQSVGRILSKLDEMRLAENTVVILFSDNGGHANFTTMAPLRGSKGTLYEGGIREPLIVRWPGKVAADSRSDEPVISTDFYPTLLDIAGLEKPGDLVLDGVSLLPVLTGGALEPRALHWHFPAYLEANRGATSPWRTTPAAAVRMGSYKLIEFFEDSNLELYDLNADMAEEHNLAEEMPERAMALHAEMTAWRERLRAPVPRSRNPGYVPRNQLPL